MLLQQVNLYQPEPDIRHKPFSAYLMLLVLSITLVIMLSFYAILFWKNNVLNTEMSTLNSQYKQNQLAVEQLEALVVKLTDTEKEKTQLTFLKTMYQQKKASLDELSLMINANNYGLSDYFAALARKNIDAVWFNKIEVAQGGQQLLLEGKTRDARSIPQFMATLKEEPIFSHIKFRLFDASLNEKDGLLYFTLHTEKQSDLQSDKTVQKTSLENKLKRLRIL